ncbi:MAG: DegT/DnrJ/EryC1/StrS family aminotransferase [Thermoanaerobaculia bacterium]
MSSVPQLDLSRAARRLEPELSQRWSSLVDRTAFIAGAEVRELEERFASFLGAEAVVGVANGTDALVLALRALEVRPGDEVIVPAFSFVASASSVRLVGATPVFADVEPDTLNLDPASVASRIGERTVGVLGVHLYGHPFAVDAVQAICREHHLWLLEDAAQAHGALWRGRRVGTFGRLATWSFYPTKNLGCFGDGGAVSGEPELVERVRSLANHGSRERYVHLEIGTNSRLDALQAAVLNVRLPLLESDNARRRDLAARYREGLAGLDGLDLLAVRDEAEPVFHQLTVLTDRRDGLQAHLSGAGIGSAVHYPGALHRQGAFADLVVGDLPVAERAAGRVLCLPMFAELRDDEVDAVCAAVREYFSG